MFNHGAAAAFFHGSHLLGVRVSSTAAHPLRIGCAGSTAVRVTVDLSGFQAAGSYSSLHGIFTHSKLFHEKLSHRASVTQRSFYTTKKPLHTESLFTQTLLHSGKLLHTSIAATAAPAARKINTAIPLTSADVKWQNTIVFTCNGYTNCGSKTGFRSQSRKATILKNF